MSNLRHLTILGAALAALAAAQDSAQPQHMTVPFRDPSAPRKLEVSLLTSGSNVTVRGMDRTDVAIDYTGRGPVGRRGAPEPPPGMHRIGGSGTMEVTEENNVVRVSGGGLFSGPGDVTILVPVQTAVTVAMSLTGKIVVENVAGELEVSHLNGDITITNAGGPWWLIPPTARLSRR